MIDTLTNLASGTIATPPVPDVSGTEFYLYPGQGTLFAANQPCTIFPPGLAPSWGNAEIGYITAVVDDHLTISRAQEGTNAKSVSAGWTIQAGPTAKTFQDIKNAISTAGAVSSVAGKVGAVALAKGDVGLTNVDNTSDANKPVSTATQAALASKQPNLTPSSQSASFTAAANTSYSVDASTAAVNTTLPATNTAGQQIVVKKTDATTNLVNLIGTINGTAATTLPLRLKDQGKVLTGDGTGNWNIYAGDLSLAALDARMVAKTGDTMTGDLTMQMNRRTHLSTNLDTQHVQGLLNLHWTTEDAKAYIAYINDTTGNEEVWLQAHHFLVNFKPEVITAVSTTLDTMTVSTNNNFTDDWLVTFTTTGTLPAPLVVGTGYYMRITNGTITLYASPTDSAAQTNKIDLTTAGTGTHTIAPDLYYNGNEHKHFSVEVSDALTGAKYTRLSIGWGQDIAPIAFNRADLSITRNSGYTNGNLLFNGSGGGGSIRHAAALPIYPNYPANSSLAILASLNINSEPTLEAQGATMLHINDDLDLNTHALYLGSAQDTKLYRKSANRLGTDSAFSPAGIVLPVVTKSANYTITDNDHTILVDATSANRTITLPNSTVRSGIIWTIKRIDASANTVTIATTSSQTIDGSTTASLPSQYSVIRLQSDGANWISITPATTGGSSSPTTTKGDLAGFSTVSARVPVGSDGQVLTADSAQGLGVKWATVSGTGSVTSASVVSANGLAGTVATASTTPAITLSTTVSGIVKGNGTALSAASAGTDYYAPGTVVAIADGGTGSATQNFVDLSTTQTIGGSKTFSGTHTLNAGATVADGQNIAVGSTTGSQIGTSTSQKIGFFAATPVVQQASTTEIGTVLSNFGLRAVGTSYPITTSGSTQLSGTTTISGLAIISNAQKMAGVSRTATFTVTASMARYHECDATGGAIVATLPTTTGNAGLIYHFTKVDSSTNTVTLAGTINGVTNFVMPTTQYTYVEVRVNAAGTGWLITSKS